MYIQRIWNPWENYGKEKISENQCEKKDKTNDWVYEAKVSVVAVIQSIYTTRQKSNILHLKTLIEAKMLKKYFIICCSLAR